MPRALALVVVMGFAAVLLGCSEPSSLPEVEWEGEHVIFAPEHPDEVCAGTREYLDRRAGQILEKLGSEPIKIEYYLLDDVSEFCENTAAAGCAIDGTVYAKAVPHLHEIVHARTTPHMPQVLEEGFAVHFGDPYSAPFAKMASRERLEELLTADLTGVSALGEYSRAGHFMAFLSELHGWESLVALDAVLTSGSSVDEVDGAFQSVFGQGLAEVLEEYDSYPDCTGNVDMSIACEGEAVPLDVSQNVFERRVDCGAQDTMGPYYELVFTEDTVEFGPTLAGNSRIVVATGDGFAKGGKMVIRRCGPCSEGGVGIIRHGITFIPEADLPAGRYVLRTYLPIDAAPADFVLDAG